jgi:molybdate transport system substrate-binding protein
MSVRRGRAATDARSRAGRVAATLTAAGTVPLGTVPLLAGCGSAPAHPQTTPGAPTGTITVLAAASLTEAFTELGHRFESTYPGTKVRFSFAASSTLASQVAAGAPADVFAAASDATMGVAERAAAVAGKPVEVATNELEIAVPPGNPGHVGSLSDFADAGLRLAVCDPTVPCGATAQTLFRIAGVTAHPDTYEPDVKAVLTKVRLGEVDAGLVYRTDVHSAGTAVEGIDVPQATQAPTSYPVAVVRQSQNATTAVAFVTFVSGPSGRAVLAEAGFGPP